MRVPAAACLSNAHARHAETAKLMARTLLVLGLLRAFLDIIMPCNEVIDDLVLALIEMTHARRRVRMRVDSVAFEALQTELPL